MTLQLKSTFRLKNVPESHLLGDLLMSVVPEPSVSHGAAGSEYRIQIRANCIISEHQKSLFLDILRAIDPLMIETVHLHGQLGDAAIDGYLGPDKAKKEQSRSRLEEIRKQLDMLLPEHRVALRQILGQA